MGTPIAEEVFKGSSYNDIMVTGENRAKFTGDSYRGTMTVSGGAGVDVLIVPGVRGDYNLAFPDMSRMNRDTSVGAPIILEPRRVEQGGLERIVVHGDVEEIVFGGPDMSRGIIGQKKARVKALREAGVDLPRDARHVQPDDVEAFLSDGEYERIAFSDLKEKMEARLRPDVLGIYRAMKTPEARESFEEALKNTGGIFDPKSAERAQDHVMQEISPENWEAAKREIYSSHGAPESVLHPEVQMAPGMGR